MITNKIDHSNSELDLVLDLVHNVYGYNFKEYNRKSVKRRIENLVIKKQLNHISDLIPMILYKDEFINDFLEAISVTVTEMFRDAFVFRYFRKEVIHKLKIFPQLNIWIAGCATGEEAYTVAILLKEEGLLHKSQIYATDFNNNSLKIAKAGRYSIDNIKKASKNYQNSGGKVSFMDYCKVEQNLAIMNNDLKDKILFSNHNLTEDYIFATMNVVLCRNVLIYFNKNLKNQVLELFYKSLDSKCFLVLGDKESIRFSGIENKFSTISESAKIYQKE